MLPWVLVQHLNILSVHKSVHANKARHLYFQGSEELFSNDPLPQRTPASGSLSGRSGGESSVAAVPFVPPTRPLTPPTSRGDRPGHSLDRDEDLVSTGDADVSNAE